MRTEVAEAMKGKVVGFQSYELVAQAGKGPHSAIL